MNKSLENKLNDFKKNGFCTIDKNEYQIFGNNFESVSNLVKDSFIKYRDGELDKLKVKKSFFEHTFHHNNIRYNGYPIKYRYYRKGIPVKNLHKNNILFGRRATILSQFWNPGLVKYLEDQNLHYIAKSFLNSENISLENASIAASYPGNTGESGRLHLDTTGFCKKGSSYEYLIKNNHLLNVFIHFSDIDENLAPLRVVPSTHLQFSEINEYLISKKNKKVQNIFDDNRSIFEDSLPEFCERPKKIVGDEGTFSCMNSGLLHSATENFSEDKTRYVMILNFSKLEDTYFYKNYSNFKNYNRKFVSLFANKDLVKKSFSSQEKNSLSKKTTNLIYNYLKKKKSNLRDFKKRINFYICKFNFKKNKLNVGAGKYWSHFDFLNLDFDKKICDVAHDLNINKNLPFKDNTLKIIYTSNNLEHLKEDSVDFYLNEFYRCLEPGGLLRITVPDAELMYEKYKNKDTEFWDFMKDKSIFKFDTILRMFVRLIAGGVVDNYSDIELQKIFSEKKKNDFLNFFTDQQNKIFDPNLLAPNTHKSWHSYNKMSKMLYSLNFKSITRSKPFQSSLKILRNKDKFDYTRPHMCFYIEAIK